MVLHHALLLPLGLTLHTFAASRSLHSFAAHRSLPVAPQRASAPRLEADIDVITHEDAAPPVPAVAIEYCTRCNWMMRSAWLSQELLTTFNGTLAASSLVPNHDGGVFIVKVTTEEVQQIVWDRTVDGGFPEAKVLKQRVRDVIAPKLDLGHSEDGDQAVGPTGRTAFDRLLSVVLGDRRNSGDPRAKDS